MRALASAWRKTERERESAHVEPVRAHTSRASEAYKAMEKVRSGSGSALELVEKLGVLEEHLGRHAYCCGERMGVDDVMRFVVLQILFTNLGELWGMKAPAYARPTWRYTPSCRTTVRFATGGPRRCRACFPRWSRR